MHLHIHREPYIFFNSRGWKSTKLDLERFQVTSPAMVIMLKDYYPFTLSLPLPSHWTPRYWHWGRRTCRRWETHLYHLLYVFFDDRRVGVGLHRHSPLIDHGGLGVRRGGGAGVLLYSTWETKDRDINITPGKQKLLQRKGICCTEKQSRWLQWIKMPRKKKNKDFQYGTVWAFILQTQGFPHNSILWEWKSV